MAGSFSRRQYEFVCFAGKPWKLLYRIYTKTIQTDGFGIYPCNSILVLYYVYRYIYMYIYIYYIKVPRGLAGDIFMDSISKTTVRLLNYKEEQD